MNAADEKNGTDPINQQSEVKESNDPKIAQDYNRNPDTVEDQEQVNPTTPAEKKTAQVDKKDGEKQLDADKKSRDTEEDEQDSDGSANAFSRTEAPLPNKKPGSSEPAY